MAPTIGRTCPPIGESVDFAGAVWYSGNIISALVPSPMTDLTITKRCINCGRDKPLSQFRLKAGYLRRVGHEHTAMCNVCATLRSIKGKQARSPHRTITRM